MWPQPPPPKRRHNQLPIPEFIFPLTADSAAGSAIAVVAADESVQALAVEVKVGGMGLVRVGEG